MQSTLFNKLRLLVSLYKKPYWHYRSLLGFFPHNIELYNQAFLHRSSSKKSQGKWVNNERLEFLGDAILDAIVADMLYRKFSNKKEGFLTSARSKIVKRETLGKVALSLGLDKFIISSIHITSHNNYMYGNALEALIGAVYLDRGYNKCCKFITDRIITPFIDIEEIAHEEVNFKSKLLEWSQRRKLILDFEVIEEYIDSHNNPIFQSRVLLSGIEGSCGTGYSKKESQQNAAKHTLKKINTDPDFVITVIENAQKVVSSTPPSLSSIDEIADTAIADSVHLE